MRKIVRGVFKFNKPFMKASTLTLLDHRRNGKFGDPDAVFVCSLEQAMLHFFADHMLAESRNKMLDTAGYNNPVRIGGKEFYSIADVIGPEPCIVVDHQRIVLSHFYILEGEPG